MRGLIALVIGLGACSVPELQLDGKQCPCVEVGYVCDTLTNRCLRTNDAGGIIDTPAATACLPTTNEVEIYRYTGTYDWHHADPGWSGDTEIVQTATNTQNSYTFKTTAALTDAPDVHVISSMREVQPGTGVPALGIVLRAQLDLQNKSRYACMWSSKTRELRIDVFMGGSATTLATAQAGAGELPTSFTMEASVIGSNLACCIREIPAAKITSVMDDFEDAGYPGLQTSRLGAAFGSFVVFKPN